MEAALADGTKLFASEPGPLRLLTGEGLRQFAGVRDGGGAADELWLGAIEITQTLEAAQYVGQMTAENAAVRMQFVDDDIAQVFEQARPLGVVRKDAGVQHVRVREHDIGTLPDGLAGVLRGIAIEGVDAEVGTHFLDHGVEFVELIFGEGFGGEQIHGARAWVCQDGVQDGQVVAEGLSAGGWGNDHDVPALLYLVEGFGLMRVKLGDAAGFEHAG